MICWMDTLLVCPVSTLMFCGGRRVGGAPGRAGKGIWRASWWAGLASLQPSQTGVQCHAGPPMPMPAPTSFHPNHPQMPLLNSTPPPCSTHLVVRRVVGHVARLSGQRHQLRQAGRAGETMGCGRVAPLACAVPAGLQQRLAPSGSQKTPHPLVACNTNATHRLAMTMSSASLHAARTKQKAINPSSAWPHQDDPDVDVHAQHDQRGVDEEAAACQVDRQQRQGRGRGRRRSGRPGAANAWAGCSVRP